MIDTTLLKKLLSNDGFEFCEYPWSSHGIKIYSTNSNQIALSIICDINNDTYCINVTYFDTWMVKHNLTKYDDHDHDITKKLWLRIKMIILDYDRVKCANMQHVYIHFK